MALLVLDPDVGAAHLAARGSVDGSVAGLADDPEVQAEVRCAVERANARLARVEQIKRYALLSAEWVSDSAELTPTMKLKRRAIAAKYAETIDGFYA